MKKTDNTTSIMHDDGGVSQKAPNHYYRDMSCRCSEKVKSSGHQSVFLVHLCFDLEDGSMKDLDIPYGTYKMAATRLRFEASSKVNFCGHINLRLVELVLISYYDGRPVGYEVLFDRVPDDFS